MEIKEILPSKLEIKHDYLLLDGKYISTIVVMKYSLNINMLNMMTELMGEEEIEISFHVERENNVELLKKLTKIISESASEIESIPKNQIDLNVLDNIKTKASELRKKIQIDNEQIYRISTYIVIKANTLQELLNKQKRHINKLFSKQIIAKPTNFRQKEAYIATLPILRNKTEISKYTHAIFLEHALAKMFPFFITDILDKKGIILGKTNNNLCVIDIFSEKNNNYNMCVFGSTGAGKSYFVKLMIIKNAYKGIRQIIIDPEGEYVELIEKLGGKVYDVKCYNPFYIEESLLIDNEFFNKKVKQIITFVKSKIQIENDQLLKNCIEQVYKSYGINENKESLYELNNETKIFIKPQYKQKFPNVEDLFNALEKYGLNIPKELKKTTTTYKKTQNTELYCFNLKDKSMKQIAVEMKIFIPKIYELITEETLIYFDEIWKCIGHEEDRYIIENIYGMFKTLRKKKAGIVSISQDIYDLFTMDNGNFGKSILNNSNIKVLFKMEWQDIEMLDRIFRNKKIASNVRSLARGNAYISMNNANFNLEVNATDYEHKLIEGDNYEENISSNEQ